MSLRPVLVTRECAHESSRELVQTDSGSVGLGRGLRLCMSEVHPLVCGPEAFDTASLCTTRHSAIAEEHSASPTTVQKEADATTFAHLHLGTRSSGKNLSAHCSIIDDGNVLITWHVFQMSPRYLVSHTTAR